MATRIFTQALLLCALASVAGAVSDHCTPYKTCKECLAVPDCGFCSQKVVYHNGTVGAQCAGFNPDPKIKSEWNCTGTYTDDHCPSGKYACVDHQCVQAHFGVSKEDCEKSCTPPAPPAKAKFYICHPSNKTCTEVPKNTTGAKGLGECNTECNPLYTCNKTTATCEKSAHGLTPEECKEVCRVAPIPPLLQGTWRGLQISAGYEAGEWKFDLSSSDYTLTSPSGKRTAGAASLSSGLLSLTTAGGVQLGMYEVDRAVETKMLTVALGAAGAPPPASFDAGMHSQEYVFMSCLDDDKTKCDFSKAALDRIAIVQPGRKHLRPEARMLPEAAALPAFMQAPPLVDACAHFADCEACVTAAGDLCGWCSTPVEYHDGSTGARCAGFDKGHGAPKFTCTGIYSTDKCTQGYVCNSTSHQCELGAEGEGLPKALCEQECRTPGQTYVCNSTTATCEKSTPGHGESKALCEASCQHPHPSNSTPAELIGEWRGLEVNLGYTAGEFDFLFGKDTFKLSFPGGTELKGTVSMTPGLGNVDLHVKEGPAIFVGKTLYGLYKSVQGPETTFETMAFSGPSGHTEPASFDAAMQAHSGDSEYVFLKCGGRGATTQCKWKV